MDTKESAQQKERETNSQKNKIQITGHKRSMPTIEINAHILFTHLGTECIYTPFHVPHTGSDKY